MGWPSTDPPSPQAHSVFSRGADQRAPLLLLGILEWPSPIQLDDVLPLLGSFGHAKTVLNANASRFGQVRSPGHLEACPQRGPCDDLRIYCM